MKRRSVLAASCCLIALLFSSAAYAEEQSATFDSSPFAYGKPPFEAGISIGLEIMEGYTQYQRGGSYVLVDGSAGVLHFPISELKFPTDVYMGSLSFDSRWNRFVFNATYKQNLNKDAGKMEDSDWGYWYLTGVTPSVFTETPREDTLDIFSASDTEFTAKIVDFNLGYIIMDQPKWTLTGILGYLQQNFDYDVSNLEEWSPSYPYYTGNTYYAISTSIAGEVMTYEITYKIPYAKLAFEGNITSKIKVGINAGYTPYVKADDEDNHLLRSREGEAKYNGRASMYGLQCMGQITPNLSLGITYDFMRITTLGECDDFQSGAYFEVIDQRSKSEQRNTALKFKYSFY